MSPQSQTGFVDVWGQGLDEELQQKFEVEAEKLTSNVGVEGKVFEESSDFFHSN